MIQVAFHINLPATVRKKKNWFVSYCPILDVCSQGETKEKALKNLSEALRLFLVSCYERGTLDTVLRECGFEPIERVPTKLKPFSKKYEAIDIPLPFQIRHLGGHQLCHA